MSSPWSSSESFGSFSEDFQLPSEIFLLFSYFVNLKIGHHSFASSNGLPAFLIFRVLFSAGFKLTANDLKEKPFFTYHRMTEAFNFNAAKRTYLQDPDYSSKVMHLRLKTLTTLTYSYYETVHFLVDQLKT